MLNKVELIGRVGRDPELRYTKSGTAVCNFSIATSEKYKDSNGDKQEKTTWHSCIAWADLAEVANNHLKSGMLVYLEGRIDYRKYEKDGISYNKTDIRVQNMKFLSWPKDKPAETQSQPQNSDGGW